MAQVSLKTDILILGAGIGGYETFRTLVKKLRRAGLQKSVMIVDKHDYFTFKPLLHEVVSGSVEPEQAIVSFADVVNNTSHTFLQGAVQNIKPLERLVETDHGTINYAYCVVALGSATNYFSVPGTEMHTYSVNSLPEALRLREALLQKIKGSDTTIDVAVVGGGYTGVEVAGQLAHLARTALTKEYPDKRFNLSIVERAETVANTLPPSAQRKALARLTKLGVKCYFGKAVKEVTEKAAVLEGGTEIPSTITIWAAGIKNIAPDVLAMDRFEKGCIPVNDYLSYATCPSLYAIGDIAFFCPPGMLRPAPQLGEAAHKEGVYVAKHIVATLQGKKIKPFHFESKGTVMPIGEHYGLVVLKNRLVLSGLIAWWFRRFIYVMFMPGLKRKIKLMMDWSLPPFTIVDIIRARKRKM
ncbi:MAG TPA: NAD(P)/FAD-dependent oxidoreductase [Patescibacteria group bacterium]|nr:NAD(P)/FAD-dependent oxidoreductase [Patescibacteria group bacterium]